MVCASIDSDYDSKQAQAGNMHGGVCRPGYVPTLELKVIHPESQGLKPQARFLVASSPPPPLLAIVAEVLGKRTRLFLRCGCRPPARCAPPPRSRTSWTRMARRAERGGEEHVGVLQGARRVRGERDESEGSAAARLASQGQRRHHPLPVAPQRATPRLRLVSPN